MQSLILAGFLLLALACESQTDPQVLQPEGVVVRVDLRTISPNGGRFFQYRSPSGLGSTYLVYKDGRGVPHAVLAACQDCYRWKKGYRIEGDGVVCVRCGMRFAFDGLNEGLGACVPLPLPATVEGDHLRIPVVALEEGTKYF